MWYSPQFPHASEDTEALGTPAPCQALGKALGIPGGEVPVRLRGPLKSWLDPDQVSPTDSPALEGALEGLPHPKEP